MSLKYNFLYGAIKGLYLFTAVGILVDNSNHWFSFSISLLMFIGIKVIEEVFDNIEEDLEE